MLDALEQFAPLPLQEDFDNAGLQVGLTEAEVSGALLCLDITPDIIREAVSLNCNLIVSHHPLIFHPLKRVVGADDVQQCVMEAIRRGITIVSMHTNMDNAVGGVNYKIAEKMGLTQVELLQPRTVGDILCGSGVVGTLPKPMAAADFISLLKRQFGVQCVMANQLLQRPLAKVALCGGAGDFLLPDAIAAGADAFVTGEMHYHQYFGHDQQIQICVIGHYQSEQFTSEIFRDIIQRECPGVTCHIAQTPTNPIIYL